MNKGGANISKVTVRMGESFSVDNRSVFATQDILQNEEVMFIPQ